MDLKDSKEPQDWWQYKLIQQSTHGARVHGISLGPQQVKIPHLL